MREMSVETKIKGGEDDRKPAKEKRNLLLCISCALLCLFIFLLWTGLEKEIIGKDRDVLTIGVFSDSYWNVQNGYSYRIVDDAIEVFEEEHPGVKVQYTSGVLKDDYSEWLAEELMEENAPDVFFVLGDDFSSFVDAGALKELTSFMEEDTDFHTDAFYSSALACGADGGRQYALPFECAPKLMFVNKTILDSEGIPMPDNDWTWDDFYAICEKVTKDTDGDGMTDQFGEIGYTWVEALESNGIRLFDPKGTECNLTEPGVEAALNFIEKLNELSDGYEVSERDFDLGNVAFQPMSFSEFRAYQPYPLSVKKYSGFQWGCIPMPSGSQGDNISTLDTLLVGMNKKTIHADWAWDFMKILTSEPRIQAEIFDYSEGVSVLRSVTESEQTLQSLIEDSGSEESLNLSILSKVVEKSLVSIRFPGYQRARERVSEAVSEIIEGDGNINMELIIWNREINRFLEEQNDR